MENRVGDNAPDDARLGDLVGHLGAVEIAIKVFGVILSKDQRKRLVHARKGSDEHVERVVGLAEKYGQLIPSIPLQGLKSDFRLAKSLRPAVDLVETVRQYIVDTAGQAENEYWKAFLAYYGVLSTLATRLPDLAKELEPVTKFMAQRHTSDESDTEQ